MAVVGHAEVIIRALTTQLKADIQKGLQEASKDAEKQGGLAGDSWVKGFKDRINAQLAGNINFDAVGNIAAEAGTNAGAAFGENFNEEAEKSAGRQGGLKNSLRDAVPAAAGAGNSAGVAFSGAFNAGAGGGGGGGRGGFLGAFLLKLLAFLPIITTLLAALSALAGGLFAVAAAASVAAVGGLAILPGVIAAVVAAIGVAIIAFGGIGKAVKELGEKQAKGAKLALQHARSERAAARAVKNAADAIEDAQERVRDAQERLSDSIQGLERARRDAARGAVDAARRVIDAEERLADAHERTQRAQEALTEARKDAKERLEDLQLSLRGAVLGERESMLRLNRARQQYQATLNNPNSTAMDQEQARIDLMQAELALDQAKDRREDVTEETEKANKAGIEGSDQVVRAKEEINDANKNLADSERELTRAREDQAQQAIDAAERISDAQESVRDAYRGVQDAVEAVAEAQERYREALQAQQETIAANAAAMGALTKEFDKLSPAAKRVALLMHSLRDEMRQIKLEVQEAVLPAFEKLLKVMTSDYFFTTFRKGLVLIGGALSNVIDKFTELFSTEDAHQDFHAFFRIAADLTESLGGAFVTVLRALLDLTAGAEPFFKRFGDAIEGIANRFQTFVNYLEQSGQLQMWFTLAADSASAFGRVFGAIFDLFEAILPVAARAGIELLDAFSGVTEKAAEFFNTGEGQNRLQEYFDNIIPNAKAVMSLLGELVAVFIRIGENPAVKEIADQLRTEFLPAVERAINGITKNLAPAVFKIFTAVTEFIASMSESKVLKGFLNVLAGIAKVFAFLAGIPIVREFLAIFAVFSVGVLVANKLIKVFTPIIKVIKIIILNLRVLAFILRGMAMANPFAAIIIGVALLVAGLILAYKKFETFRNVVNAVVDFVKKIFWGLLDFLLLNSVIPDIVNGTIEFFTNLKDAVVGIFTAVRDFIVAIWNGIKAAIELVVTVIATIITTYVNIWKTIITTALNIIKTVVSTIFNGIKAAIEFVLKIIRGVFDFYFNLFKTIFRVGFDVIKTVVSTVFGAIKASIEFIAGGIRAFFERFIRGIKRIWEGLWNTLSSVATTVFGGVKTAIDNILGGIRKGFETAVGFIADAWDGIREAISKPIRTVIDVAYNKGIVKFWNKLANVVDAPELKEIRFAKGGYVPGYAPGRDSVRAVLSPGEGILVPEAVRGLARQMGTTPAKAINAINAQWTSRVPGGGGRFAGGGFVSGSTRNAWGDSWIKDKWNDATDWFAGQLAKGAEALLKPIYKLVDDAVPQNKFGTELLAKVPRVVGDKILGFLRGKDAEADEDGGSVGGGKIGSGEVGSSYRALVRLFKQSDLPGVVTSTVRRPRFPGDQSNHIRGLAADFSGSHGNKGYGAKVLRDIFHLFADNVGKDLRELILAGAPFNIKKGKKVPGYSWGKPGRPGNHWNHVHVAAMAQGGTVLPRQGGTLALLAEAGRPESVVDTGLLNNRLADLASAKESTRTLINEVRRQNEILERIGLLGGIHIDRIEANTNAGRDVGYGVARSLRGLAFELGQ